MTDSNGEPYTGAKKYTMTFKGGKQAGSFSDFVPPGFWSLTMYDGVTRFTVPNAINRYTLGSDNKFPKNPDGSFTIYIQHDNPGSDKDANWFPAPSGPFYLFVRNYAPSPALTESLKHPATIIGPPSVVPVN
jgi:hypothetical protein